MAIQMAVTMISSMSHYSLTGVISILLGEIVIYFRVTSVIGITVIVIVDAGAGRGKSGEEK